MSSIVFDGWVYETNDDNTARFILGEKGDNPLVCIGVNPSTAEPNKLDPTLRQVRNRSIVMGYDGWVMFNIYPQRSTNPDGLHKKNDPSLCEENADKIVAFMGKHKRLTVWAAWGALVEKRDYLKVELVAVTGALSIFDPSWISIGPLSQKGHPHHPLYLSRKAEVNPFQIKPYIKKLFRRPCNDTEAT